MTKKRIGLFGNFGGGNLGNEGSLEVLLRFLRQAYPSSELVCICVDPDVIQKQFDVPCLPIYAPRKSDDSLLTKIWRRIADHVGMFRNLSGISVLLVPGTGILDDFGERPIGMPYMVFLMALMAKLRGVKVAFVSVGAGPMVHPLSRWFMKSAVRLATFRSYRDQISKDYMADIGVDVKNDPVYPDLAFRLPDPLPEIRPSDSVLTVGLGVMTYVGWHSGDDDIYAAYLKKMTDFSVWLLNNGYQIRLLIGESGDDRAVNDILDRVANEIKDIEGRIVADVPHSLHDIMSQIAAVDVVVATRFHNVLCALKVGKPTISIGYAKKNDVMMTSMGLGAFCHHVERLDLDALINQFRILIEQRDVYQDIVKQNNSGLSQKLEAQENFLKINLLNHTSFD
jgi:polysaccharide pyruvyl transferase WcaK-like protein